MKFFRMIAFDCYKVQYTSNYELIHRELKYYNSQFLLWKLSGDLVQNPIGRLYWVCTEISSLQELVL